MTKSKIINMKIDFSTFKLISIFFAATSLFITMFIRNSNCQNLSFIQDAEIENTLLEWVLPLYKVAGLNSNSVKMYLINDDSINAFVAGGQNIFINTGLILHSPDHEAVIGVIAHEIGHIAGGHLIRTEIAREQSTAAAAIGTIVTVGLLVAGQIADADIGGASNLGTLGMTVAQRTFLKHTRDNEKTADIAALKYLNLVGRSARPLAKILKIIGKQELLHESRQDPYLRTHPFFKDRIETIEANINANKLKYVENPEEKLRYQRIVAKIIAFTEPPGKTLLLYPKNNNSIANRYARAIAYLRMPDFNKGLSEINYLIKNYPKDPYFPELLGQMFFENGKPEKAITALKLSLDLLPNEHSIMLSLARAQLEVNKKSQTIKALKNLKKIIKMNSEDLHAWRLISISEARLGNHGRANLAAAERAYRIGKFDLAIGFAKKARKIFKKGTPNDLRAQDIIFYSAKKN